MKDSSKTKQALTEELASLRRRIGELEQSEVERKKIEEALRESEELFRSLFDRSLDCLYIHNFKGQFMDANPAALRLLGYEKEEIPFLNFAALIGDDEIPGALEVLAEVKQTGFQKELSEFRVRRKDGSHVYLETKSAIVYHTGKPSAILGVARDITKRKQMEDDLRISEERYRTIIKNIEDGYYEVDTEGNMTFCNPAAARMLGYRQDELIGLNNQQYMNHENARKVFSTFNNVFRTGQPTKTFDWELIRRDGEKLIVETSVSLIRDTEEKPVGFRGIFRDTTERKQAEEAMRESEERYRTLVENASDIVFRLDDTGHITFVNPAALRIMGYEEKEIIGRHYPTFIRPDMQEEAMNFFGRQFVKGIPNTYSEYPVIVKDGREIWLGQNTQLICQDGKVVAFQAVARDITERKRIGEALQDSENRYRELSIVDDLTQLYNSRYFYNQLRMEIDRADRYGQPLTLLLLDLDDFKRFNDAYGHVEGDQVLLRLGQVVKRCLRQTDSAYRYGGEEFTVLLPMTTGEDGAVTAERIRGEFKKETFSPAPGQDVHVTVSIGLGQYKTQEEMKVFVHRVDQLMYCGKKNGKDRVCCES
jgi:diguanylate cyclase (GGDEF)-like protein/PAS domain S-box-containing protein